MRSSGASRELTRRQQQSSGRTSSPLRTPSAAVVLETAASRDQAPAASVSMSEALPSAPEPEAVSADELPPAPIKPTRSEPALPLASLSVPEASVIQAPTTDSAVVEDVSAAIQPTQTLLAGAAVDSGAAASLADAAVDDTPTASMETAVPAAVAAVAPADVTQTLHDRPAVEEPQPKRLKPFRFGLGLAHRRSGAQAELTLPTTASAAGTPTPHTASDITDVQASPATVHAGQDGVETEEQEPNLGNVQFESPQQPDVPAAAAQQEAESPEAALPPLEDLLARNSPNSMVRSSYAQIFKDLEALQTHKTQLESSVKEYAQEEEECRQRAQAAQALRDAQLRAQQQLQHQQDHAAAEEAKTAAQLKVTTAEIAVLQAVVSAPSPVMSDVSESEEEDASISSQDDSESESDDEPEPVAVDIHASRGKLLGRISPSNGEPDLDREAMALVRNLQALEQAPNSNVAYLLNHEQNSLVAEQVSVLCTWLLLQG